MKKILGIAAYYHDASACIIIGGKIIAAAQEERFTRKKHTATFPSNAIRYCLEEAKLDIDDLDAVVFYDKPLLKFERLLESYYAFSPKGLSSFLKAVPVWLKEKLFLKRQLIKGLKKTGNFQKSRVKFLFPEHHLSHAASTFYPSSFQESAILTIDGVGEWCTASVAVGKNNRIEILKELHFPHSLGLLYSAVTYYLGFAVNSGEYKLMGLAPYGNPNASETKKFIDLFKAKIVDIKQDGSIWLNQSYFNYTTGLKMTKNNKWEKLFGLAKRIPETEINQHHCNFALAIQTITEEVVLKMAQEAKKLTGLKNLCMAGGVALNCVANGKLQEAGIFENIFIQPAAGDAGGSIGACLAAHHIYFEERREIFPKEDSMQGSFLGPSFSDSTIKTLNQKYSAVALNFSSPETLCEKSAELLQQGFVIGWFQGRMEFGPRALGNRSILADPGKVEMQKKVNLKIKYRESFRPFAPAILEEDYQKYFQLDNPSPYMLFVAPVHKSLQLPLPSTYFDLPMQERLQVKRSKFQSITHVDFSARVQTVNEKQNPIFYRLLKAMKQKTGHGILLNTSFNVRGEPIVCTPEDAYRCFMQTEMDYLIIENYLYSRKEQPHWENKEKWASFFELD